MGGPSRTSPRSRVRSPEKTERCTRASHHSRPAQVEKLEPCVLEKPRWPRCLSHPVLRLLLVPLWVVFLSWPYWPFDLHHALQARVAQGQHVGTVLAEPHKPPVPALLVGAVWLLAPLVWPLRPRFTPERASLVVSLRLVLTLVFEWVTVAAVFSSQLTALRAVA